MVSAGDFKNGITLEIDGTVYQILEFQHVKPGKGAAFVRTKLKNIACLWTDGTIMLNGRCLADIAKDLSRTYATNIVIADTALAKVRFYGVFHRKDQNLPQILNVLAGTGRIKYAIKGNDVKIY